MYYLDSNIFSYFKLFSLFSTIKLSISLILLPSLLIFLKIFIELHCLMSSGRLLNIVGPMYKNENLVIFPSIKSTLMLLLYQVLYFN